MQPILSYWFHAELKHIFLNLCDKYRALFNYSQWFLCLYVSFCMYNIAFFVSNNSLFRHCIFQLYKNHFFDLLSRCRSCIQKWSQLLDSFLFSFSIFLDKSQLLLIPIIWCKNGWYLFNWCIEHIVSFSKASPFKLFEAIVILRTEFWYVRMITLFWSGWINIYLSTTLLFLSFSIFDFNYFSFARVWCDFVE